MTPLKPQYTNGEVAFARAQKRVGFIAHAIFPLARLLGKIGRRLNGIEQLALAYQNDLSFAGTAAAPTIDRNEVGYEGDKEELTFFSYRSQLHDQYRYHQSEAEVLYQNKEAWLGELLGDPDNKIKKVLNFGVCYAYVDKILAEKFPSIEFIGLDRSPMTKAMNEVEFGGIPNLRFVADDVFNHLKHEDYEDGVFFHARTMLLFNRPLAESFYDLAARSGFGFVAGFEQFGISRATLAPYEFSTEPRESEHYRGPMYIHNYPWLLRKAGFETTKIEIIKTGHPHPDYRFLNFIARRQDD